MRHYPQRSRTGPLHRRPLVLEQLESRDVPSALPTPTPSHVVVVIEENRSFSQIIGSPDAPYINSLAQQGALMTASNGVEHPSQPNYLDLFSGSNQGTTGTDARPSNPPPPFTTPNLGAELQAAGRSFVGYSESLPTTGFDGDSFTTVPGQNQYQRKHNPMTNWVNSPAGPNQLPASVSQPFANFPTDFNQLPTVAFVVPNEQNDMHDGSTAQADTWLKNNLDAYVQFARNNNSLLVLTFDEDLSPPNHIPTIFVGQMIQPGSYDQPINHFNVLRTIEDLYDLPAAGASASATPITSIFKPVAGSAATATTLTSASPNPALPGQAVTFVASVTSSAGVPSGSVQFLDTGNVPLGGSGPVSLVNGVATLQLSNLGGGAHLVTAAYAGATGFQGSTSPAITETVNRRGTIGMFDNSGFNPNGVAWYLRSDNSPGFPDAGPGFVFGAVGWKGVVGDWNGDGLDTVGVVDPSGNPTGATWYLRNSNSNGAPDIAPFVFGLSTWTPIAGDWTGRGHAGVGMFDPATGLEYLQNDPGSGTLDAAFQVGLPGMIPVAGDFFGLGHSGVGVVDPGLYTPGVMTWYLKEVDNSGNLLSIQFQYGVPGWKPVVGDWNGDGIVTIGAVDPTGTWYLRNSNSNGAPDFPAIPFGLSFWAPVAGRYPPPAQALRAEAAGSAGSPGATLDNASDLMAGILAASTRRTQTLDTVFAPGL